LEDLSVDGRIIIKRFFKKKGDGLDWTDLAQVRDRWRANVNAEMNRRLLQNVRNTEKLLASQEELYSTCIYISKFV